MRDVLVTFLDYRLWLVSALVALILAGTFAAGFKAHDIFVGDDLMASQLAEERERNDRLQAQLDALTQRQDALVRQQDALVQRLIALGVIPPPPPPPVPPLPDDTGNILTPPDGGGEAPKVE